MKLLQELSQQPAALKVAEVAKLFRVTPQHIYKLAACGELPSFRIAGAIRFDPHELAEWLAQKAPRPALPNTSARQHRGA